MARYRGLGCGFGGRGWGFRAVVVLLSWGALALAALVTAGSALADTTTVGEVALTPNGGLVDTTGQNIPVFQGDASGNYVLSSPQTGTITSWSFLSAGIATGEQFVLRVLAPVGAGGTTWQAVATSDPVTVSSATGVDAVNGPFPADIAIDAGDRIALQPTGADGDEPIEQGVNGQDGIRYFVTPFDDGSSAAIAPGSGMDNGQVVPIQATVQYTPATPPSLANVAPPAVISGSTPANYARDGEVLSCRPGTYNDSPTTHTYYWFWSETTYVRTSKRKLLQAEVFQTALHLVGQTVTLPDLPAFARRAASTGHDTSTIACEDSAGYDGQTLAVQSAQVWVKPLVPMLATRTVPRGRKKPVTFVIKPPSITAGVGAGGTNRCSHGVWSHFPTDYQYFWYDTSSKTPTSRGRLLHTGQTLKLTTADEGVPLECYVFATNDAGGVPVGGRRHVLGSNIYRVPASAPRPTSAPVVTLSTDDPHRDPVDVTASTHATLPGANSYEWASYTTIAEKIHLGCDTGTWNRNDLRFTTRWFVNGQAIDITGDTIGTDFVSISDPYSFTETVVNPDLRFNFTPDNTQEPTLFNGTVTCIVTATTPQGLKSDSSSLPITIWNGCNVGIEPWDQKILRYGPLCDDYAPYYNNS